MAQRQRAHPTPPARSSFHPLPHALDAARRVSFVLAASRALATRATQRGLWVWLLPAFLLLAQGGEYRHELAEFAKHSAKTQKQAPAKSEVCRLCLAFGHLAATAKPEPIGTVLLATLRFERPSGAVRDGVPAQPIAARSRGPPRL